MMSCCLPAGFLLYDSRFAFHSFLIATYYLRLEPQFLDTRHTLSVQVFQITIVERYYHCYL